MTELLVYDKRFILLCRETRLQSHLGARASENRDFNRASVQEHPRTSRSRHSRQSALLHHVVFEPDGKERIGKEEARFCFFYEFAFCKRFL